MPPAIAFTNGKANAAYLETPAWHGLGTVASETDYPEGFTPQQAMDIAETDFEVGTTPIAALIDGEWQAQPDYQFTYRTDTKTVFAPVSKDYKTIQNRVPMQFLGEVAGTGEAGIVAHAALLDGRRLFAVLDLKRFKGLRIPYDPSKHDAYLVAQWWHDGTGAFTVTPSMVRVECQNMADMNLRSAERSGKIVRVPHIGDTTASLEQAQRILGFAEERTDAFVRLMTAFANTPLPGSNWIEGFTERLIPVPEDMVRPGGRLEARATITDLYKHSKTLVGVPDSAYRAFNAVTEYADHYRGVRTSNAALVPAKRFTSIVDGPAADLKALASRLLREEFEIA
jgi:phage/plasmid-like protein (TIGR03299 family)